MIKIEHTQHINRPAADVFSFISDAQNDPLWETGVEQCVPEGPATTGQKRMFVMKVLGRRNEGTAEIVEFEPARKLTIQTTSGPAQARTTYRLQPVNGRTQIHFVAEIEPQSGLLKLFKPLMGRMLQKQWEDDLAKLKRLLEE